MLYERLAPSRWIGHSVGRCQRIAASPPNIRIEVRAGLA